MASNIIPDAELDCVGLYCPMPISKTKQEIDKLEVEQVLKVEADDTLRQMRISSDGLKEWGIKF